MTDVCGLGVWDLRFPDLALKPRRLAPHAPARARHATRHPQVQMCWLMPDPSRSSYHILTSMCPSRGQCRCLVVQGIRHAAGCLDLGQVARHPSRRLQTIAILRVKLRPHSALPRTASPLLRSRSAAICVSATSKDPKRILPATHVKSSAQAKGIIRHNHQKMDGS